MIDNNAVTTLSNIVSKLSIFILIIAGNFADDVFSCSLRNYINENMLVKHLIGFFIMLFFVGLVLDELTLKQKISQSLVLYIWFIFIMRSPLIISLIIIVIIIIIFIINLYIKDLENLKDKETDENNKQIYINKIRKYTIINNWLFLIGVSISIIGCIIYISLLKYNIKSNFSIIDYLLGRNRNQCYYKDIIKITKNNPLLYDIYLIKNYNKKS